MLVLVLLRSRPLLVCGANLPFFLFLGAYAMCVRVYVGDSLVFVVRWLNGRKEVVIRLHTMMIAPSPKKCDCGTGETLSRRRSEIYLISLGKEQPKQQRSSIIVLR